MSLLIHKPGIQASIQDGGRFGYQHWGVPVGGAMDIHSMQAANRLCGNEPNTPVIECTLHGTSIEFQYSHRFAITGGGAIATLNKKSIPFDQPIVAAAGDLLQLHPSPHGCRSYLAIENGFDIETELNSCSTYSPASLGGISGNYLKSGDIIPIRARKKESKDLAALGGNDDSSRTNNEKNSHPLLKNALDNPALTRQEVTIQCHQGPEWDWFKDQAKQHFVSQQWMVGANSNRMGYSLIGPALEISKDQELVSTPVTFGIVQVTSAGQPIVLMADAQTTGGYPRIARIALSDLSVLAQCRPGIKINFQVL